MDYFAQNEKKLLELREQIVKDIRETLTEKGYSNYEKAIDYGTGTKFQSLPDRILINDYHTDQIGTDELLKHLRTAMKLIPNDI